MNERRGRSFAKAVSWRLIGTLITSLLVFAFTGKWGLSIGVGVLDFATKIVGYYVHERIWLAISWGK